MKKLPGVEAKPRVIPREIRSAFELIEGPLGAVEGRIGELARAFDPAVEGYVAYACESSGKRLRPALALLAGGATGEIGEGHLELAVILELTHAASLVHDDVMDGADVRRGRATPNAVWGNTISVLLGDCMFAHALKIATHFSDAEVARRLADAALSVCSGEILQTQGRFDVGLSLADYFKVIEMKTATLFSAATELGALLNGSAPEVSAAMKAFGGKLGIAYQIYDDCLDIAGDEASAGKTLGSDLRKGKLTLPVLHLLQSVSDTERERWRGVIVTGEGIDELVSAISKSGSLSHAIATASNLLEEAQRELKQVPNNRYRQGLQDVCEAVNKLLRQFV